MNFVDDIDFVFTFCGGDDGFFAQISDIVDASVAGGVDFDDVKIIVFEFVFKTIDFVSENTRNGSLASATWANKKLCMSQLAILQ